jgi:hypothetical protein
VDPDQTRTPNGSGSGRTVVDPTKLQDLEGFEDRLKRCKDSVNEIERRSWLGGRM